MTKIEIIEGRRLCCVHRAMAERAGEMRLIVPLKKGEA